MDATDITGNISWKREPVSARDREKVEEERERGLVNRRGGHTSLPMDAGTRPREVISTGGIETEDAIEAFRKDLNSFAWS